MNWYACIRPLLFALPPEAAHSIAIAALKGKCVPPAAAITDGRLQRRVAGLVFPNPVGLAAGFDKNAECIQSLSRQGFGFIETGTATPKPQTGNPKPRLFRLMQDQAIINRMGFNNAGAETFAAHLAAAKVHAQLPIGANIGKNKTQKNPVADYLYMLQAVYPHCDYVTVNISSPNTPGLRDLQEADALASLLNALREKRMELTDRHHGAIRPMFLKIAPDIDRDALKRIVETVLAHALEGMIISNTTVARPESLQHPLAAETGGLSGRPLFAPSTALLAQVRKEAGEALALIGAGGILSADDAIAKFNAGADLVQVYTGLIYCGFSLVTEILERLLENTESPVSGI